MSERYLGMMVVCGQVVWPIWELPMPRCLQPGHMRLEQAIVPSCDHAAGQAYASPRTRSICQTCQISHDGGNPPQSDDVDVANQGCQVSWSKPLKLMILACRYVGRCIPFSPTKNNATPVLLCPVLSSPVLSSNPRGQPVSP